MGGSHGLETFVNEVARDAIDPQTKVSLFVSAPAARAIVHAASDDDRRRGPLGIGATFVSRPLGSGSDYTPFLQHLGVASLSIGFGGEDEGGEYHSIYDSIEWYTKYSDGDFTYGRTLSQLTGTAVLRLSEAAGAAVPVLRHVRHAGALRRRGAEAARRQEGRAADRLRAADGGGERAVEGVAGVREGLRRGAGTRRPRRSRSSRKR